jgi:hypothetical protein
MTGIYNFRTFELLNMRRVPFLIKGGISMFVAYRMTRRLYERKVYDPDIYRLAIKYRAQFDKSY